LHHAVKLARCVVQSNDLISYEDLRIKNMVKNHCLAKSINVVERTFGWVMGCRRLVRDYELLPETSETFIYLAMIRIMVRRLA
jgi:transposase